MSEAIERNWYPDPAILEGHSLFSHVAMSIRWASGSGSFFRLNVSHVQRQPMFLHCQISDKGETPCSIPLLSY